MIGTKERKQVHINTRIENSLYNRLRHESNKLDQSISETLREALKIGLKKIERENKKLGS